MVGDGIAIVLVCLSVRGHNATTIDPINLVAHVVVGDGIAIVLVCPSVREHIATTIDPINLGNYFTQDEVHRMLSLPQR